MSISIERRAHNIQVATIMAHETDTYGVSFVVVDHVVQAFLDVYDPDHGPQGWSVSAMAETHDVGLNVRKCLARLAEWSVRNLSGWRARQALEAIGEAMELAD